MAKRHRMTPRRRAALKKAQAASARKRRKGHLRSVGKAVGTGALFVGGTFAAYHVNRYIIYPNQAVNEIGAGGRAIGRGLGGAKRAVTGRKTSDLQKSLSTAKKWSKGPGGGMIYRG